MNIETFRYEIGEEVAHKLGLGRSPVSHNFWVLTADDGMIIAERHDLATDRRTGRTLVIGLIGSVNRYYTFTPNETVARNFGATERMIEGRSYILKTQERQIVFSGPDEVALDKWNTWGALVPLINKLNIPYPPLGLRLPGITINSNSGYVTGAYIMGLKPHFFPSTWNPGKTSLLLSKTLLDFYLKLNQKSSKT